MSYAGRNRLRGETLPLDFALNERFGGFMKSRWILLVSLSAGALASLPVLAQAQQKTPGAELLQVQEQEARAQEEGRKQQWADTILAAREAASRRPFSSAVRASLTRRLMSVSAGSLEAFANAGGLGNIDGLVTNALGDSAADLVFTAVTPCRIVNTVATATPLAANSMRAFYVNGSTAGVFEAQGGNPGGCGIPDSATAVAMNFIAVGPTGAGDLRAFPWSAAPVLPLASVINYANVPGLNIANGEVQPVCDPAGGPCAFDLFVQADVAQTHLIIDVEGYYNRVDKSPVKSLFATSQSSATTAIAATCTNYAGGSVTITAPVAGRVIVRANTELQWNHTVGTYDQVELFIGTTATDCTAAPGFSTYPTVPASAPTGSDDYPWTNPFGVFTVTPGTKTFFLNGIRQAGSTTVNFYWSGMEAIFVPN